MEEIRGLVRSAVNRLIEEDGDLLRNDTGEQAISHQLAVYLKALLPEWHVDCEYNRDIETVKRLKYALNPGEDILDRKVVPDIIVHHRKTSDNLLVIEIKKTTNPEPDNFDIAKLKAFCEQLNYREALFLRLITGEEVVGVKREFWIGTT